MRGDYDWANEYLSENIAGWGNDDWGQAKLDIALYTENLSSSLQSDAYFDFIDYMFEEYGYDFEEGFDWDAYREWYSSQ